MPVSPQDYALWSRMTGNPIPTSPAERMAIAPQVYDFSRNLGRRGGEKGFIGKTIDVLGKTALAAGAIAGSALLAKKYGGAAGSFLKDFAGEVGSSYRAEQEQPQSEVVEISLDRPATPVEDSGAEFKVETPRAATGISLDRPVVGTQERGPEFHVGPAPQELSLASGPSARERTESFISGLQLGAKLQLDDEVAVDNDVIASNPSSNTALASQDITSADPASAIGQRISSNQTSASVAERVAVAPKQTVASKLSQQQSPVHLEEADSELVGAPAAGAAEAFRKGRQYQEMRQRYSTLQSAEPAASALPEQTPVGTTPSAGERRSAAVLPTVTPTRAVPVVTDGPSEQQIQDTLVGLRKGFAGKSEPELRNLAVQVLTKQPSAPAAAVEEVEVVKPAVVAPVAFLKERAGIARPAATQRGTVEHAVAEAMEQREGMRQPPEGTQIFELPKGGTRQVKLYPSQQVGVVYANDPHTEYSYKSSPEYYGELEGMLKKGEFVPGGTGFIQAGKNLGYLY